jgi:hypothetical protein
VKPDRCLWHVLDAHETVQRARSEIGRFSPDPIWCMTRTSPRPDPDPAPEPPLVLIETQRPDSALACTPYPSPDPEPDLILLHEQRSTSSRPPSFVEHDDHVHLLPPTLYSPFLVFQLRRLRVRALRRPAVVPILVDHLMKPTLDRPDRTGEGDDQYGS